MNYNTGPVDPFTTYIETPKPGRQDSMTSRSSVENKPCPTQFLESMDAEAEQRGTAKFFKLLREGPVFRNHRNEAVWFEDLDFDLQHGLLTYCTRPIDDQEAYMWDMPKGKWSDYEPVSGCAPGSGDLDDIAMEDGDGGSPSAMARSLSSNELPPLPTVRPLATPSRSMAVNAPNLEQKDRPNRSTPRPPSMPYEIVQFVGCASNKVARMQPGIESSWHESKYRMSLSKQLHAQCSAEGRTPFKQGPGFTPGNVLPRAVWAKGEQHPLSVWVNESEVGSDSRDAEPEEAAA